MKIKRKLIALLLIFFSLQILGCVNRITPKYDNYPYKVKQNNRGGWEIKYGGSGLKTYKLSLYKAAEIAKNNGKDGFILSSASYDPRDNIGGIWEITITPSNDEKNINYIKSGEISRKIKQENPEYFE